MSIVGTPNTALSTPHRPSPLLENLSQSHLLQEKRKRNQSGPNTPKSQRSRKTKKKFKTDETLERLRQSQYEANNNINRSQNQRVMDLGEAAMDPQRRQHKISVKDIFLNRKQQFSFSGIYKVIFYFIFFIFFFF